MVLSQAMEASTRTNIPVPGNVAPPPSQMWGEGSLHISTMHHMGAGQMAREGTEVMPCIAVMPTSAILFLVREDPTLPTLLT